MFIEMVDGPFWYAALSVFLVGVIWRLASLLRFGLGRDLSQARGTGTSGALRTILRRFLPRRESLGNAPVQVFAGYAFHLGLFALLLFAAPHVTFIEERLFGFGWTPMPRWAFVVSAELAFAGLILLWLRRLMHPVTRLLSSRDDHLAAGLTFIAMFTGCLALTESFEFLRALHLFTVELLMVYFPFSSLMHTFTFVFSRGFTGATFGRHGAGA